MTRWPLALVALCGTGSALAQPVTHPEAAACHVSVALAPDDVRTEIEAWVRAEPRCKHELEVRVVPSDEGLYLQARDGNGRVRERVVPDAQSAAVLVVSWMADDSLGPSFPSSLAPPSSAPSAISDAELPPDMRAGVAMLAPHPTGHGPWRLTLGALRYEHGGGLRAQLDLVSRRGLFVGVVGGWRDDHATDDGMAQARVLAGAGLGVGRLSLRAQLGLGFDAMLSHERDGDEPMMTTRGGNHDGVTPRAEAGVLATFEVARGWGLVGGPLVELTRHERATASIFLGVRLGL